MSTMLIAAMAEELEPLYHMMNEGRGALAKGILASCQWRSQRVTFLVTGVGQANVERMLTKHREVIKASERVIFSGVCGAVSPVLRTGALMVPHLVMHEHGARVMTPPPDRALMNYVRHTDMLLTFDRLVTRAMKESLRASIPDAGAVDMESYYAASWFAREGVAYTIVKAVADGAQATLPDEHFIRSHYRERRLMTRAMLFFSHPREMIRMLRLKRCVHQAVRVMTVVLTAALKDQR